MCLTGDAYSYYYRVGVDSLKETKVDYRHGGNPKSDLLRFGLPNRSILDFSVNLNSLGPPAIIKNQWMHLFRAVEAYPSVAGDGISNFYQNRFDLGPENILAANGSTEMIYLVPRALQLRNAAIFTPSFHDYTRASLLAGASVCTYPLSLEHEFAFPEMHQVAEILEDADALWIGRPNNPTGGLIAKQDVLGLAEQSPQTWFIVDEAFIQFVNGWEQKTLLMETLPPNVIVLHSLTKFYALAGLRMGAVVASDEVILRLRKSKEPWTVNGIADKIAPILLKCNDYEQETHISVTRERDRVFQRLLEIKGIHSFASSANFFLCQWCANEDLDHLIHYLLTKGVYVRDCRNFPGLEAGFFRFGLRSTADNELLIDALASAPYSKMSLLKEKQGR